MAARAPFLNTTYSAYHHRERPAEDEELTRVGPQTPCGEYLRRFWQPVILASELGNLPRRVRILSEDLVAYRDKSGSIGLLELHCPHRGTSLEFGLIGEKGIRCCYHGWLFGVDGTILETPGEPADSTLKDRLFHGAYPIHEAHGLVFAYMGPPAEQPPFPVDDTNTMFIELRHVSETDGETPAWWADRAQMLPGQIAADSYEEGQRRPGDYEAQVSQRSIAIHGLEHLSETDRGVSLFRQLM